MSTVFAKDKRSGITYAYESHSYWDKETKMPRCKRTLIGRVDPATGEIVPTDGRCKKLSPAYVEPKEKNKEDLILERIKPLKASELRKEIVRLELELQKAQNEIATLNKQIGG